MATTRFMMLDGVQTVEDLPPDQQKKLEESLISDGGKKDITGVNGTAIRDALESLRPEMMASAKTNRLLTILRFGSTNPDDVKPNLLKPKIKP